MGEETLMLCQYCNKPRIYVGHMPRFSGGTFQVSLCEEHRQKYEGDFERLEKDMNEPKNWFPPDNDKQITWEGHSLIYPSQMEACFVQVLEGEYDAPELPDEPVVRIVLDIGAACGGFSLWAKKRWPTVERVFAVEPDPDMVKYLAGNLLDSSKQMGFKTEIFPRALASSVDSKATLHLGPEGHRGFNSIYPGVVRYPWHERTIEVDAIMPEQLPAADVLKIDAEGVELLFFERYRHLDTAWWILFEWHRDSERRVIEDLLTSKGFSMVKAHTQDRDLGVQTWCRTDARMCRRGVWKWLLPQEMPR